MNIKIITVTLFMALGVACSSISPGGYYWGTYSYTYHDLLKEPSSKSRDAHELSLRDIISKSGEKNLRVPPGIHAELGNLLANKNMDTEALAQYEAEQTLYPESRVFLEKLLSGKKSGEETK
jgi:hypothetical protein